MARTTAFHPQTDLQLRRFKFEGREKKHGALVSKTSTTTSMRFPQYLVVHVRETASFWRENVITVIILLRVLARMSYWRKKAIKCKTFYRYRIGRGLKPLQ